MAKAKENEQLARLLATAPEAYRTKIKKDLAGDRAQTIFRLFREKTLSEMVESLPKQSDWSVIKDVLVSTALGSKKHGSVGGGRGPTIEVDEETLERVLDTIKSNNGIKKGDIANALSDVDHGVLEKALRILKKDRKTIKMTGDRATAKYTAK